MGDVLLNAPMRAGAVALLLGAALTLPGCGGSPQPGASRRALPIPAPALALVFGSPRHEADGRTLARARERLIAGCMTRRGVHYRQTPVPPAPPLGERPGAGGYGLYARVAAASPRALSAARRMLAHGPGAPAPHSARFRRALDGDPRAEATVRPPDGPALTYRTGGCYAAALGRLYGGLHSYEWLVASQNAAALRAGPRLAHDARLAAAARAWRSCMAAAGFDDRSPAQARDRLFAAYIRAAHPQAVRARELATAAADARCAERSRLYAVEARARRGALAPARWRVLSGLARRRAAAVRRARAVLRDSAPGRAW